MTTRETVIVYAKRTAIGKLNGGLSSVPAPLLGAALVRDAMQTTNLPGQAVDELIMGNVLTAGIGQAPARQTGIYGQLPESVCATTIGKVCGSGLKAVMLADQAIRLGEAEVVLAGGQENMSLAPHLLPNSRAGYKFGSIKVLDSMQHDGLWDPYSNQAMGNCGDICAEKYQFTRQQQDEFAYQSYRKARIAVESGLFAKEIVPVSVKQRKKETFIKVDEEPFSVNLDRLGDLRPAFDTDGTVTAGNASTINDGAAILLLMEANEAEKYGFSPIARILSQASFAQQPTWFTTAPVGCIQKLLKKCNLKISDIDKFEINEAFSVVTMAAMQELDIPKEKVNCRGGAVSLGHPIGTSGARILVTLVNTLQSTQAKRGLATICIGGGEASGIIIEAV